METYIGMISIIAFNYAPRGWALCNGQLLSIQQNQALFAILGTTYGGDGARTFALPDLRGRFPVHAGNSPWGLYSLGEQAGRESVTLTPAQMPQHTHAAVAAGAATAVSPAGNVWAQTGASHYAAPDGTQLAAEAIGIAGGNQAHPNIPPVLTLNFAIALTGIFPSRD